MTMAAKHTNTYRHAHQGSARMQRNHVKLETGHRHCWPFIQRWTVLKTLYEKMKNKNTLMTPWIFIYLFIYFINPVYMDTLASAN